MAEAAMVDIDEGMVPVCKVSDMPADGGLRVDLPGRAALAVFSVNGTTFVFDDLCTHGDASLADGEVQGVEIICPYHMGSFDMRTGEPMAAPCSVAINVYPSEVRDGVVYAQLPAV